MSGHEVEERGRKGQTKCCHIRQIQGGFEKAAYYWRHSEEHGCVALSKSGEFNGGRIDRGGKCEIVVGRVQGYADNDGYGWKRRENA
jgi:hypothetical protein